MKHRNLLQVSFWLLLLMIVARCGTNEKVESVEENDDQETVLRLPPSSSNPRNSEGSFLQLKDGKLLYVYTHFTSGYGDGAHAYLAARVSMDAGKTWAVDDLVFLPNDEAKQNIMAPGLLRLQNGNIALFYLRKNSHTDCKPMLRISTDEANTWSEPVPCIPDRAGYFVLNHDRPIQLENGRLLISVKGPNPNSPKGGIWCYYSDDNGKTWRSSKEAPNPDQVTIQEPGIVELKDGSILMFIRTDEGVQYISHSMDKGETWGAISPSTIKSPLSPASIKRIPSTGDLLMVWNNNSGEDPDIAGKRTPLNVAISKDEGVSWQHIQTIEDHPRGWYCYTAIHFTDDHVLLAYCAGIMPEEVGLSVTHVTRLHLDWVYENGH